MFSHANIQGTGRISRSLSGKTPPAQICALTPVGRQDSRISGLQVCCQPVNTGIRSKACNSRFVNQDCDFLRVSLQGVSAVSQNFNHPPRRSLLRRALGRATPGCWLDFLCSFLLGGSVPFRLRAPRRFKYVSDQRLWPNKRQKLNSLTVPKVQRAEFVLTDSAAATLGMRRMRSAWRPSPPTSWLRCQLARAAHGLNGGGRDLALHAVHWLYWHLRSLQQFTTSSNYYFHRLNISRHIYSTGLANCLRVDYG